MKNIFLTLSINYEILKSKVLDIKNRYNFIFNLVIIFTHLIIGCFVADFAQSLFKDDIDYTTNISTVTDLKIPHLPIPINKYDLVGNSNNIYVIDAGHGGLYHNTYQTKGKQSYMLNDGRVLYEGQFNRDVANRIWLKCRSNNIKCINLINTYDDIKLSDRKKTIEKLSVYCKSKNLGQVICISIHANAAKLKNGEQWNDAKGWSVYTDSKDNGSDVIANILTDKMKIQFPNETFRVSRGYNKSRESDAFTMVKLKVPCIISENFFMTNKEDVEKLLNSNFRESIATAHYNAIDSIEVNNINIEY